MKLRTAYSRIMCFFPLFFFGVRIFSCFAKARQYYYNLCDKAPPPLQVTNRKQDSNKCTFKRTKERATKTSGLSILGTHGKIDLGIIKSFPT